MLPPKKNQAVRDEHKDMDNDSDKARQEEPEAESEAEQEEEKYVNVFEETVVEGKRKHHTDRHGQALKDWIKENFEEKEGRMCAMTQCYTQYLQLCIQQNLNNAMEEFQFTKHLKKQFPKGFGLKEDSTLKNDVTEKKMATPKVKADSLKLKMKDVIKQGFEGLENPLDGLMFNTLKRHLIGKFPALQLDIRPKVLLRGLELGVYHGYVELLRGVGRSGKYRWYDPEKHEKDEKERKQKKNKKDSEDNDTEDKVTDGEKDDETPGEETEKQTGDEDQKEDDKTDDQEADGKKKKKVVRKRVVNRPKKPIVHSNPQKIEDTFPLALTFMAEPKEASMGKILSYINKFYDVDVQYDRLQKVLEKGCDNGYWEFVRGSGKGAVYRLTVESFDPTDDEDLLGKVVNAVMGSVHPKCCSAKSLKQYLVDFHPEYRVSERPHLFKKALERAEDKRLLSRMSGIGASGTFQLSESFVPSPIILAGKDTASDYEESDSSEGDMEIEDSKPVDISQFLDAYKPRPTKRRGKVREVTKMGAFDKNAHYVAALAKQQQVQQERKKAAPTKRPKSQSMLKVPKKKARYDSSSEDSSSKESEESEDESEAEVDSTYGSDTAEKYRPRPSKSRGGPSRGKAPPPSKKKAVAKQKGKSPKPAAKKVVSKKVPTKSTASKKTAITPAKKPAATPRKPPANRSQPPSSSSKKKAPVKALPSKGKKPAKKGAKRRR